MNKTAIRNFAVWARNKLIADISYHAGLLGITKNGISKALPQSTKDVEFYDIGTAEPYAIRDEEIKQRKSLVEAIRLKEDSSDYETAYSSVIEEIAYTWFNRLIAVRFMEVNDYLPEHVRVLSSESGKQEPDIVTTPFDAGLFFSDDEKQKIVQMKSDNKLDEVFRILFIKQCRELSRILPRLFEGTNDYTELLLSLSFIDKEGVVYHLVSDIPEDDFNVEKGGQVEIIGWLYQYYNAELKDETFALLKNNVKVTKERIPSATQLFTPDWIVRYMVENSLGRLWVEGHPNDTLKSGWKYYLDEAEQEASVKEELEKIRAEYAKLNPEDIKIIDPCMGSGHILVYAFDVLMQIYESVGYTQRDAAKSILKNNLFGLDIDDRAAQLAYFAVMMKARQYNRRILDGETDCNVYAIKESNNFDREALVKLGVDLRPVAERLLEAFIDAKEYGSIITVDVTLEELDALDKKLDDVERMSDYGNLQDMLYAGVLCTELDIIIRQARVLVQRYDSVISNPPYMGNGNMSDKLSCYVKKSYLDSKGDLFAIFIEKSHELLKKYGFAGLITQHAWMFITSYEKLREKMSNYNLINMAHLGLGAFPELNSKVIQSVAFIYRKAILRGYIGNYNRLFEKEGVYEEIEKKENWLLTGSRKFNAKQDSFGDIPGKPVVYWASQSMINAFKMAKLLSNICNPKQGLITGDNEFFLRIWTEVNYSYFSLGNGDKKKWYPINKGGDYRKWYGNREYVVNWACDGYEIKNFRDSRGKLKSRPQNLNYNFKKGISWSLVTTAGFAVRYYDESFTFNVAGITCFPEETDLYYLLGLLNTKVVEAITKMLNPTINMNAGDVARIPVIVANKNDVIKIAEQNTDISKKDWDSFETSWDFKKHPLI